MNRLIFANTYFQLIAAIQLRKTNFKDDQVDIIISDRSNGSYSVYKSLKDKNVFHNISYLKIKEKNKWNSILHKFTYFFCIVFKKSNYYEFVLDGFDDLYYDEIITYNFEPYLWGVYAILANINPKVEVSMYEEGILSYTFNPFTANEKFQKAAYLFRKLIKKPAFDSTNHRIYCFLPEYYDGPFITEKINPICDSSTIELLKDIFNVNEKLDIKEKYIYLSSVHDFEGGEPVGELQLVQRIAELVGRDNLLVKVHPRDDIKRFEDVGLKVLKESNVPWEILKLCIINDDKVLMTAISGSLLSNYIYESDKQKCLYLYNLCKYENNWNMSESIRIINRCIKEDYSNFENILLIKTFEELEYYLLNE